MSPQNVFTYKHKGIGKNADTLSLREESIMFENFKNVVAASSDINDEQIETFYWLIVKNNPDKANEALELLSQHRSKVAEDVAKTILESYIKSLQEV